MIAVWYILPVRTKIRKADISDFASFVESEISIYSIEKEIR